MTVPPAMPTVNQITFGNDLGAEGAGRRQSIECGTPPCEYITYKLTDERRHCRRATTAPCTLRRVNTANSTDLGDPVVENVAANGLTFTFLPERRRHSATSEGDSRHGAGKPGRRP